MRRTVEIATAIAAVVVAGRQRCPAGMGLAVDKGLGRLALGVE
jgi:hypothetical protein